jgi:putative phage-type endonuclease
MSEILQGTDEWFAARAGKFTGSRFADVLAKAKKDGRPLKARQDLIWSIAAERIQGYQAQGPNSYSLRWGTENEPLAREAYEIKTGEFVTEIGFVIHPQLSFIGVSPDGLIGDDGLIEIKAPKCPEIHLQRFLDGVPDEYVPQIQGGLFVTDRQWCDFISYDPDTLPEFRLLIIRVARDEKFIADLKDELIKAEMEVCELVDKLKRKVA